MKTGEQRYVSFDPYAGDDSEVECRKVSVSTSRFPHFCSLCNKEHPAGTRMRVERAKVEGSFQSNYVCLKAIDKYLKEDEASQ